MMGSDMFYIYDLKSDIISEKSWKTYNAAVKHATQYQIVSTLKGIVWMKNNPEWIKDKIKQMNKRFKS